MIVQSLGLSWPPYIYIDDCINPEENTKDNGIANCPHSGSLHELGQPLAKKLGQILILGIVSNFRFNFTFEDLKAKTNDWGLFPKNGTSYDFNGIWDGVMGKVK